MKYTFLLMIALFFSAQGVKAQSKKTETLKIHTSAICKDCKERIEKSMAYEKGVKHFNLDVKSKDLTVEYIPGKTTPDKIRKAVSDAGYDADDVPANPKAYEALPDCCKKDGQED
jgi:cation transport ATPase